MQATGLANVAKFRTRLAELREKHGISRMDLVRQANMTYPTVMAWENEELATIDANKVSNLMHLFQCSLPDIIYVVEDEKELQPVK